MDVEILVCGNNEVDVFFKVFKESLIIFSVVNISLAFLLNSVFFSIFSIVMLFTKKVLIIILLKFLKLTNINCST